MNTTSNDPRVPHEDTAIHKVALTLLHLPLLTKLAVAVGLLVILGAIIHLSTSDRFTAPYIPDEPGVVISESLSLPPENSVVSSSGRIPNQEAHAVSFTPQNEDEMVVVPDAILTLNKALSLGAERAGVWAGDASLVFIKSLGAVNLRGESSSWQIVYASKERGVGREIIIQGDTVSANRSTALETLDGGTRTPTLRPIGDVIKELQQNETYKNVTMTGVTLYHGDGGIFRYVFTTSKGTFSVTP